jgi:hypothetical protein
MATPAAERQRRPGHPRPTGALCLSAGYGTAKKRARDVLADIPRMTRLTQHAYWMAVALDGVAVSFMPLSVEVCCQMVPVVFDPK